MEKPTLLYVSPFWPKKSGISEYSEALIAGLDHYFDLTLVIENYTIYNKEIRSGYNIIKYKPDIDFSGYDFIIYNFGNNPECHIYMYDMIQKFPGYIILHDFVLYYLTVGYYQEKQALFQKIYEMEGIDGIQIVKRSLKKTKCDNLLEHKKISALLPLNKEIIEASKGIFVHSFYSKNNIEKDYGDRNISVIPHVKTLLSREDSEITERDYLYKKFNIKKEAYIVGSIGFISQSKQNKLTCLAVKKYNQIHNKKIYYVMIGDGGYVDDLLDEYIMKTGFLGNEEFFKAINSCNLIVNLRYPYNGEASGTLIQCMDMKKPCIVTDIGWFSELPENAVIKVPYNISADELCTEIEKLKEEVDSTELINNAKNYVDHECNPIMIAEFIYKFIACNIISK
jgi:hypothetical protein